MENNNQKFGWKIYVAYLFFTCLGYVLASIPMWLGHDLSILLFIRALLFATAGASLTIIVFWLGRN